MRSRPRPRRSRPPARRQQALSVGPIRVRMGVHTGRPHVGQGGLRRRGRPPGGADRRRRPRRPGARLAGDALRSSTEELRGPRRAPAEGLLGAGVDLPARGGALSAAEDDLEHESARPASSFVGREREVADVVRAACGTVRGSSRSPAPAARARRGWRSRSAAELVPEFRDGVFWVGAAAVRDPALVAETHRPDVGRQGRPGRAHRRARAAPAPRQLRAGGRRRAGARRRCSQRCPNLRLLVTSRELLRVRGGGRVSRAAAGGGRGGRALLRPRPARARATTIAELCRRLDNLPSRSSSPQRARASSPPRQILERLAERLDSSRADAMPRRVSRRCAPRSNGATICSRPTSSGLFARLSVFAGGCTSEAAETVCGADAGHACSRSSTRASSATRTSASGCSRRSASSRSSDSRRQATPRTCGSGTATIPRARRAREAGARGLELVDLVRPARKRSTTTSAQSSARRSSADTPTSPFGSRAPSSISGLRAATGARAAAGSSPLSRRARRAIHSSAPGVRQRRPARRLAGRPRPRERHRG